MPLVTVNIPSFDKESRIGQAFNALFRVIAKTEAVDPADEVEWNFSESQFLHPFLIAGLCVYRHNAERKISLRYLGGVTGGYLLRIHFESTLELMSADDAIALMEEYKEKSYIPICKFGVADENTIDSVTSALQRIIQRQASLPGRFVSPLSYLISELTTNIHDHSRSGHGFMFSQYLSREGCINLCIADTGVSIYGSFLSSGKFDPSLLQNEGDVLNMALNHHSTKNLRHQENRGFGLPTTKNMLVDGMGGSFFILSGNAFHRHENHEKKTAQLPPGFEWNGTIVLLKIPVNLPEGFNYLDYIERI